MESDKSGRMIRFVVSALLLVAGVTIFLVWKTGALSTNTTPATWRGIIPGQTTKNEAYGRLGIADLITSRGDYVVYRYLQPEILGWDIIELWVKDRDGQTLVIAVFLSGNIRGEIDSNLEYLVVKYGRPDDVRWGIFREERYLIWSDNGISASASAHVEPNKPWREYGVFDILIFEPMDLDRFDSLWFYYPWADDSFTGWASTNMYSTGDAIDPWPQDPFNWSHLPETIYQDAEIRKGE